MQILSISAAVFVLPMSAMKPASGILTDPATMGAVFGAGPVHHQALNGTASGSASVSEVDALPGLQVNYLWAPGFDRVENTLGVSNYLHFTGNGTSIQLTTRYHSLNQTNWAGVGSTGAAPDGVMRVTGEHAWYIGPIGGSWQSAEIAFGALGQLSDDPVGSRNSSFTLDAGGGEWYGVQGTGFIISNIYESQSFTATFYNYSNAVLASITGTGSSTAVAGDGDEIFFGYAGDGNDLATWVSRVVITGNNAGKNTGLDNLAFTPITVIPEPSLFALPLGLVALFWVLRRRRR